MLLHDGKGLHRHRQLPHRRAPAALPGLAGRALLPRLRDHPRRQQSWGRRGGVRRRALPGRRRGPQRDQSRLCWREQSGLPVRHGRLRRRAEPGHLGRRALALGGGRGQPADRYNAVEVVSAISGAAFLIRRAVLDEIGAFDAEFFLYYEDTDLSLRAMLAGYHCLYVPTSIVHHQHVFKLSALKCYYQERNRYVSLLRTLRWRTLCALT